MNNSTEQIFLVNSPGNQSVIGPQKISENTTSHVNLENVEDFSNVCRTCATITEFVIPIFMGEGLQNNLADKIHRHLPIQVSEQDVLPRVVCYQCASTLLAWHELVQCCVQADKALKTRLTVIQHKQKNSKHEAGENLPKESQAKSRKSLCVSSIKQVLREYFKLSDEDLDHSGLEFICEKCNNESSFPTLKSFVEHLKLQHNFEIKDKKSINFFIKEYVSIVEMLVAEDQIADLEPEKGVVDIKIPRFYCPFCESAFSSTTRLICHLNQHVDICIEEGVACCDNVYKDTKSFAVHLQERHVNHPPNAENICQSCGFTAEDCQQLQSHVSKEHYVEKDDVNDGKERVENQDRCQKYIPAVCPECNKTFSNKYNMLVHMKSHNGTTEKFICNRCNKTYKSHASLKFHQKVTHEGILSFLCTYCGEAFPSRVERDVHTRIHSGDKPYTCKYCGNSYRAKNTLDRHIEIHLDIRKHECHICSKKFRKRTHLNYHLTTHKRKK